ncbi:MAG: hypothetical protein IJV77_03090 [Clostridia bacterium]|nr:hypothetical protein [Clostridia bacterium]
MELWAKLITNEKITKSTLVEVENLNTFSGITKAFMDVAEALGVPTPVITRTSAQFFFDFNTVRFKQDDFVESVDFDSLVIERA